MSKFKVGDKVRVIKASHGQRESLIGSCFTVTAIVANDPLGGLTTYELNDHPHFPFRWYEAELEPAHKIDCNVTENFLKELERMGGDLTFSTLSLVDIPNIIESVQQWSDEHPEEPVKTFADDFFEKFPNALKDENGVPCVGCPHHFGYCEYNCDHHCKKCWNRPLSEVKK